MEKMSTVGEQIAERARKFRGEALTNLHQFIDEKYLQEQFIGMNKYASAGVDKESWKDYAKDMPGRIEALHSRFKGRTYRAPNIRRVYIPKGNGEKRPLGIPTIEDKILQGAVSGVLEAVYEQEFYEGSYGFRRGRSAHDAIRQLAGEVNFKGVRYIIDADIRDCFGSIDHGQLRDFLATRIKDGVIRVAIDKWLKAGVMESGQVSYPKKGTPQGGSISPILSNIYLHNVLDKWFEEEIRPRLSGHSVLLRYADDFILGFTNKRDAERVMEVLPKRFAKYKLELHPEKTKMVELGGSEKQGKRDTFNFLGFTHYMGRSRKGRPILKHKTMSSRKRRTLKNLYSWIKDNRHVRLSELIGQLNRKLEGHYGYYGITHNSRSLSEVRYQVKRILFKWLNRRGGAIMSWQEYAKKIDTWLPLAQPRIKHSYLGAKP
jgi:RNA-directed DNA polymerase